MSEFQGRLEAALLRHWELWNGDPECSSRDRSWLASRLASACLEQLGEDYCRRLVAKSEELALLDNAQEAIGRLLARLEEDEN